MDMNFGNGIMAFVKVLIVDDNSRFRALIRQMLESSGLECIECGDGEQAIKVCNHEQPDWVLLDIEMPGMGGFEVLQELVRRSPQRRVVLVTAFDTPTLREKAVTCGATAFVPKEDLHRLSDLIPGFVEKRGSGRT